MKQFSKAGKENKIFSQNHSTYKTFCSNAPSNGTKGHEKLGFNIHSIQIYIVIKLQIKHLYTAFLHQDLPYEKCSVKLNEGTV